MTDTRPIIPASRSTGRANLAFLVALGVVTLIGADVRMRYLDHPMRYDEAYNYLHYSSQSPAFIASHYVPNNHIFHTLLVRVTTKFFGTSPWALRIPAFLAGVALIPVTALLAWLLSRRYTVSILAALAVCASSQLIEYSANSRGYTWFALLATLLVICTIRIMNAPERRRAWLAWALIATLGAYTIPVMVCPVAGLVLAILWQAFRAGRASDRRRQLTRGLLFSVTLTVVATGLLYLPIVLTQGPGRFLETGQWAYRVWGRQIDSYPAMAAAIWSVWTRHAPAFWAPLLAGGFLGFVIGATRRRNPQWVVPLLMIAGAALAVWILRAPLRPRTWIFALPTLIACAMCGLAWAASLCRIPALRGVTVCVLLGAAIVGASGSLLEVRRERWLTSEPHVLVDVETVLEECADYGLDRCALLMRFTPATQYYRMRRGWPPPRDPEDAQTDRVFIVADGVQSLAAAWHEEVPGYRAYGDPRLYRNLARSSLYVADRRPEMSLSAGALQQSKDRPAVAAAEAAPPGAFRSQSP